VLARRDVACHDVDVYVRSEAGGRRARRIADAVFIGVSVVIMLYRHFDRPGYDRFVFAIGVGYLAVAVAGLIVYRLSGVTFRQLFRLRRFREQSAPPVVASMDVARELAQAGRRIQATQMVRQLSGMPLKEAVAVVKEMERKLRP
jgi:hypothetical protein